MRTTSKGVCARLLVRAALVLLVLSESRTSRGEPITPAKPQFANAEHKLEAARGRVSATAEYLSTTRSLRIARQTALRACQSAYDAVERLRKDAEKAEALARSDVAVSEQLALQATRAVEPIRAEMRAARDRFLDHPLLAYDLAQHGTMTFNTLTGAFELRLDDGPGVELKADDVESLLAGHFQLPEIDPLRMAWETYGTRTRHSSNYAVVRARLAAKYGAANVYLMSPRFLDWASSERLAGGVARTQSGTADAIAAEARRQIELEYEDIAVWLRLKRLKDLGPDPSAIVAELIRTGSHPRLGLSLETRAVAYAHRRESAGRTGIPAEYVKRLRLTRHDLPPAQELVEERRAFVLIWQGRSGPEPMLASQFEGDFRLPAAALGNLASLLPPRTDPRVRHLLGEAGRHGLPEIDTAAPLRRAARAVIGLRSEDLSAAGGSSRVVLDLRPTDLGEIVAAFLSQLALGNRKACDLDMLELDQASGRLEAEFTLRHRHAWPTRRQALAQLRNALGPIGTDVEDLADLIPDAAFDTVRKRYHEADRKAHEAARQAYEARRKACAAADRVTAKAQELAALARERDRAGTELRTAIAREVLARGEAQAACAHMLELDAQVPLARHNDSAPQPATPTKPLMYGGSDSSKRW